MVYAFLRTCVRARTLTQLHAKLPGAACYTRVRTHTCTAYHLLYHARVRTHTHTHSLTHTQIPESELDSKLQGELADFPPETGLQVRGAVCAVCTVVRVWRRGTPLQLPRSSRWDTPLRQGPHTHACSGAGGARHLAVLCCCGADQPADPCSSTPPPPPPHPPSPLAVQILQQFELADLANVRSKSGYLAGGTGG